MTGKKTLQKPRVGGPPGDPPGPEEIVRNGRRIINSGEFDPDTAGFDGWELRDARGHAWRLSLADRLDQLAAVERVGEPKPAARGLGKSTVAASRAVGWWQHLHGIRPDQDTRDLADRIIKAAVKRRLPECQTLTVRPVSGVLAAIQDGIRWAELPDTD